MSGVKSVMIAGPPNVKCLWLTISCIHARIRLSSTSCSVDPGSILRAAGVDQVFGDGSLISQVLFRHRVLSVLFYVSLFWDKNGLVAALDQ